MGFVSGLLGIGHKGGKWTAQQAPVVAGVNQGQVGQAYNQAQSGLSQQQSFLNALSGQNGIQNQSSVLGQQQGLANMLGAQALGYGPNPAMAQLSQTTGQNVAQQAALQAGQRGAGANVGLMARQIGQQGAGIQQQAVGQAAVMRANQQLAAQQALQQQQQMMAGLSTQQVGQQAGALLGYNQAAQSEQQSLLNALAQLNQANVSSTGSQNAANAAIQGTVAQGQQGLLGGVLGGVGAGLSMAHGGVVPGYADGGEAGPSSFAGKFLKGWQGQQPQQPATNEFQMMGSGAGRSVNNGMSSLIKGVASHLSGGGAVQGKAKAAGDSFQNDTVPAMLSPGEIVIPRHIIQSDDPVNNSAKFVQAILARNGKPR